jgi:hypothetical protein
MAACAGGAPRWGVARAMLWRSLFLESPLDHDESRGWRHWMHGTHCRYCVFFSSLAMISVAVMFTPQGGNSLGVKKLSVRFDQ